MMGWKWRFDRNLLPESMDPLPKQRGKGSMANKAVKVENASCELAVVIDKRISP